MCKRRGTNGRTWNSPHCRREFGLHLLSISRASRCEHDLTKRPPTEAAFNLFNWEKARHPERVDPVRCWHWFINRALRRVSDGHVWQRQNGKVVRQQLNSLLLLVFIVISHLKCNFANKSVFAPVKANFPFLLDDHLFDDAATDSLSRRFLRDWATRLHPA